MLATDPLSLVFVACIVFAGAFLILSSVLGLGHGHAPHFGHGGHLAHTGHIGHAAHVAHVTHAAHATSTAHTASAHTATTSTTSSAAHTTSQGASHATTHTAPQGQATADASTAPAPVSLAENIGTTLLGALNLHAVLMFLLVFGLLGYILHNSAHASALLAIFVPLLLGLGAAVGTSALLRHYFEADSSGILTADDARIEGQLGTVTMAIREGGLGEVVFTREGRGRQSVGARGADGEAIPAGTDVVILSYDQGIANVQTWERFMSTTRAARLASPPPGELHD